MVATPEDLIPEFPTARISLRGRAGSGPYGLLAINRVFLVSPACCHVYHEEFCFMISTSDLKKGATIEFEGLPCSIIDWQHVKIGRGGAIVRMKLRNLRSGSII